MRPETMFTLLPESHSLTGQGSPIAKVKPFFLIVPRIFPKKWQPRSFCLAKDVCRVSIVGVDQPARPVLEVLSKVGSVP